MRRRQSDRCRSVSVPLRDTGLAIVDECVVAGAQQDEIVETGRSSVGPVPYVMGVTPSTGCPAGIDDAATISGSECLSQPAGNDAGRSTDVEHL